MSSRLNPVPATLVASLTFRDSYIWFGSNAILFVFTYFLIPETRDRTLEEIHEMFQAKLPARKFKGYVCVSHLEEEGSDESKQMELDESVHAENASNAEAADGQAAAQGTADGRTA